METLTGKRIVVTRSQEDFEEAAQAIRQLGGIPIACPTIDLLPSDELHPIDEAIQSLNGYDWIFFTSPHAVKFFFDHLDRLSIRPSVLEKIQIAVVGAVTENALIARGINPDFVAEHFTGEHLFHEFKDRYPVQGQQFFLPLSNIARETLPTLIREHGGEVTAVTTYCNVPIESFPNEVFELLKSQQVDWVLFFSSSAATNFYTVFNTYRSINASFAIASIGPSTSKTLRELGVEPTLEAQPHTLQGLLDAIALYITNNP